MNYVKKILRSVNKGVTMLEMLLVLAVIAVLLILATRYYMSTSYSQKVGQLQAEISAIQAATSNYKIGDPTLSSVSINKLYTSGYLAKADLDSAQANALTHGVKVSPLARRAVVKLKLLILLLPQIRRMLARLWLPLSKQILVLRQVLFVLAMYLPIHFHHNLAVKAFLG